MSCFITSSDFITPIIDYDYTYKQNRCIKYLNIYILKNKLKVNVDDDDEKKSGTNDLCLLLM